MTCDPLDRWPLIRVPKNRRPAATQRLHKSLMPSASTKPLDLKVAHHLSEERIENLECPPGRTQAFLRDAGCRGLSVRITSKGAKSFVFESKVKGKTARITIGDAGAGSAWSILQARRQANELRRLVDLGIDPRDHAREQAAAQAARAAEDAAKRAEEQRLAAAQAAQWRSAAVYRNRQRGPATRVLGALSMNPHAPTRERVPGNLLGTVADARQMLGCVNRQRRSLCYRTAQPPPEGYARSDSRREPLQRRCDWLALARCNALHVVRDAAHTITLAPGAEPGTEPDPCWLDDCRIARRASEPSHDRLFTPAPVRNR